MYIVTSDWHWADDSDADTADYATCEDIMLAVANLNKDVCLDGLVLAGDWIDFWKARPEDILKANKVRFGLLKETLQAQGAWLYWVLGNHDGIPQTEAARFLYRAGLKDFNVCDSLRVANYRIEHGHQYEKLASGWTGQLVTGVAGWLERQGWMIEGSKYDPRTSVNRQKRDWLEETVNLDIRAGETDAARYYIYGHTHHAYTDGGANWHVVNCGAPRSGFSYVEVYNMLTERAVLVTK